MKEKKEQCKYCKFAKLNEEYLESTEAYPPEYLDYLTCKKDFYRRVEDDGYCDKFKLDKRVYRESHC